MVLELGAGIGRFTGELAQKAGQVIALDFIDSVIKKVCISHLDYIYSSFVVKLFPLFALFPSNGNLFYSFAFGYSGLQNESINGHHKNVKFMCADVTSPDLNISAESTDLIFSNWLLMYLSDKEVNCVFISKHNMILWK